jgi:exonuclease SbcC
MIPQSLKLRGAVGIWRGLGLDEIEIDFSKFENGLIAFIGDNGSGKTTTIENLHPYLQLASRRGALGNHFRLRDSHRDFRFVVNNISYRSYILIDGQTGKTEAYLYENDQPLNDGKVSTYNEVVEKKFGTAELFFRSVFSAQKRESLVEATAGERKELFYELLNLHQYERYTEYAKTQIVELENEVSVKTGQSQQIETQIIDSEAIGQQFEETKNSITAKNAELSAANDVIEKLHADLVTNEKSLSTAQEKKQRLDKLDGQIEQLHEKKGVATLALEKSVQAIDLQISEIQKEINLTQKIVDSKELIGNKVTEQNTIAKEIEILDEKEKQLMVLREKKSLAEAQYQQKLVTYNAQISLIQTELREKRQSILDELNNAKAEIQKLNSNAALEYQRANNDYTVAVNNVLNELASERQKILDEMKDAQNKITNAKTEHSNSIRNIKQQTTEKQHALESVEKRYELQSNVLSESIDSAEKASALIDEVPCRIIESFPAQCKLLTGAIESKSKISELQANLNNLQFQKEKECLEIQSQIDELQQRLLTEESTPVQEFDSKPYELQITDLEGLYLQKKKEISVPQMPEPTLFDSVPFDERIKSLETEYSGKDNDILKPVNDEGAGIEKQIASLGYSKEEHAEKKKVFAVLVKEGWTEMQREAEQAEIILRGKVQHKETFLSQKAQLQSKADVEIKEIEKQLIELRSSLAELLKIDKHIADFNSLIASIKDNIVEKNSAIEAIRVELTALEASKSNLGDRIDQIKTLNSQLIALRTEIATINKDIERWRIIARACSKEGIPALEIDSSGAEVSRIANDLLAKTFDTQFQIQFETTKQTKDGKKQTETFDIKVFTKDGEQNVELLSGGEKVWIEKSIQEAISIFMTEKATREYRTSFNDESDGALSPGKKQNFLEMMRESHRLGRRHFGIIITQTPEISGQIQQQVVFHKNSHIKVVY